MLMRLLLLFTLVPLVELTLLIWLSRATSLTFTVSLVVLTGVLGAALARYEGLRCWRRVEKTLAAGQLPADPLLDALLILVAGALLVTPGVLTDVLGFGLLLPVFRRTVKNWLKRRFQARVYVSSTLHGGPPPTGGPPARDRIIETRVIDASSEEVEE